MNILFKIFAFANITLFISIPVRAYSIKWAIILEGILFFFLTLWLLRKYAPLIGKRKVLLAIVLGLVWLELPARLTDFSGSLFSIQLITNTLLAIAIAYLVHKGKMIIPAIGICLWTLLGTIGQTHWVEYVHNKDVKLNANISQELLIDKDGEPLSVKELPNDYVLLDIWSSSCGVCFIKFPQVQELYNELKKNDRVTIASIFTCTKEGEDVNTGISLLQEEGWTFPVYCIEGDSPIFKICNFNAFPKVLILDCQRNVIFAGSIEFAKDKIKDILKSS